MKATLKKVGQLLLPKTTRKMILKATRWPRVGNVEWGHLRRTKPISPDWGGDRGLAVDRYFIEQFLDQNRGDIKGRVLEIGDNAYTLRFGGEQVKQSEILHGSPNNPDATYVGDLADAPHIPDNSFDCSVCTQTLHLIPDLDAGIATLIRTLKPGGVLLLTVPGISKIYREPNEDWTDYWRFTTNSLGWMMGKHLPADSFEVKSFGNVLSASAFLYGLAAEELTQTELDETDEDYQMLLAVRAVKPA